MGHLIAWGEKDAKSVKKVTGHRRYGTDNNLNSKLYFTVEFDDGDIGSFAPLRGLLFVEEAKNCVLSYSTQKVRYQGPLKRKISVRVRVARLAMKLHTRSQSFFLIVVILTLSWIGKMSVSKLVLRIMLTCEHYMLTDISPIHDKVSITTIALMTY